MKETLVTKNRILAAVAVLALSTLSPRVWADQVHVVQFNISGLQSGPSNLLAPNGRPARDSGEPVNQMQALVDDAVFGPLSISGGALSFVTPNPTSVVDFPPGYFNYFASGGGTLALTGSVLGLPDDSLLMTATFAPAIPPPFPSTTSVFVDPTTGLIDFSGLLNIISVNPMLLSDLGAGDVSYQGFGTVAVTRSLNTDTGSLGTVTGITALLIVTPEPGTAFLSGTALLGIVAGWRRGSRTRARIPPDR